MARARSGLTSAIRDTACDESASAHVQQTYDARRRPGMSAGEDQREQTARRTAFPRLGAEDLAHGGPPALVLLGRLLRLVLARAARSTCARASARTRHARAAAGCARGSAAARSLELCHTFLVGQDRVSGSSWEVVEGTHLADRVEVRVHGEREMRMRRGEEGKVGRAGASCAGLGRGQGYSVERVEASKQCSSEVTRAERSRATWFDRATASRAFHHACHLAQPIQHHTRLCSMPADDPGPPSKRRKTSSSPRPPPHRRRSSAASHRPSHSPEASKPKRKNPLEGFDDEEELPEERDERERDAALLASRAGGDDGDEGEDEDEHCAICLSPIENKVRPCSRPALPQRARSLTSPLALARRRSSTRATTASSAGTASAHGPTRAARCVPSLGPATLLRSSSRTSPPPAVPALPRAHRAPHSQHPLAQRLPGPPPPPAPHARVDLGLDDERRPAPAPRQPPAARPAGPAAPRPVRPQPVLVGRARRR